MTWGTIAAEQKAEGSGAAGKAGSPPVAQQPVEMFFAALAPHLEVSSSSAALLHVSCCALSRLAMLRGWASHQVLLVWSAKCGRHRYLPYM